MRERIDLLENRTRRFAIDVICLSAKLRGQTHLADICRQLVRASASVSANQRAMRRARSMNEFASKLQIVNEEIDEAAEWLDMLVELSQPAPEKLPELRSEALELRAIYAKARATTRRKIAEGQRDKGAKGQ